MYFVNFGIVTINFVYGIVFRVFKTMKITLFLEKINLFPELLEEICFGFHDFKLLIMNTLVPNLLIKSKETIRETPDFPKIHEVAFVVTEMYCLF